jgi:hypothetical protein
MVKRQKDEIVKDRMASAMCDNRDRDLRKEVNKIRKSKSDQPISVDNVSDTHGINSIFHDTYKNLYNSVPYNLEEMESIRNLINSKIKKLDEVQCRVTVEDVAEGIKHLKTGKSDGEEGLMSDHFIYAPHSLTVLITVVFNAMLIHGMSPESMIMGTMVPIPKAKRQVVCQSDKFRAITLSSIFSKVLDWVILIMEHKTLCSSELQFGFKSGVSTTHCTMALQETVNYYNFNKTNAYIIMLDASKAFDRVEYCKLFKLLLKKSVSPLILRLLINMYTNKKLQVRWGHVMSEKFGAVNGVKQGGVLSPILFSIYMDELLLRLKKSGIGCHIGNVFVAALAYADDVTLICPTLKSLQRLIKICEEYADEYNVNFNGLKSKFLVFKGRDCILPLNMFVCVNGERVVCELDVDHLGHKVSSQDKDSMVKSATGCFWRYFNLFMAEFGHVYGFVKCKLFKQYCCSFYGSPLWPLQGKGVDNLCVAWRKALRMIWRIHPMSHNYIVAALSEAAPLEIQFLKRFVKFYDHCKLHMNPVVQTIIKVASLNPMSQVGKNIKYCKRYGDVNNKWINDRNMIIDHVNVIRELIDVRENRMNVEVLDMNDIDFIINSLCID